MKITLIIAAALLSLGMTILWLLAPAEQPLQSQVREPVFDSRQSLSEQEPAPVIDEDTTDSLPGGEMDLRITVDPSSSEAVYEERGSVVWKGRVFDCTGTPLERVRVNLVRRRQTDEDGRFIPDRVLEPRTHKIKTDHEGAFLFEDLKPAVYAVTIAGSYTLEGSNPEVISLPVYHWGKVTFDGPCSVERDLRLRYTGAVVSGRVVEGATGILPQGRELHVQILKEDGDRTGPKIPVHPDEGTFRYRYLPAGSYSLRLEGAAADSVVHENLKVDPGQRFVEVEIKIPLTGTLRLVLDGFLRKDYRGEGDEQWYDNLEMRLTGPSGEDVAWYVDSPSPLTLPLACGSWKARLSCPSLGAYTKEVKILHDVETTLIIFRADLHPE